MGLSIPSELSSEIWRILCEECGNRDDDREKWSFQHYVGEDNRFGHEWRFQGALGFGGKFYNDGRWRVGCYPEDKTAERGVMIDRANARLADIPR